MDDSGDMGSMGSFRGGPPRGRGGPGRGAPRGGPGGPRGRGGPPGSIRGAPRGRGGPPTRGAPRGRSMSRGGPPGSSGMPPSRGRGGPGRGGMGGRGRGGPGGMGGPGGPRSDRGGRGGPPRGISRGGPPAPKRGRWEAPGSSYPDNYGGPSPDYQSSGYGGMSEGNYPPQTGGYGDSYDTGRDMGSSYGSSGFQSTPDYSGGYPKVGGLDSRPDYSSSGYGSSVSSSYAGGYGDDHGYGRGGPTESYDNHAPSYDTYSAGGGGYGAKEFDHGGSRPSDDGYGYDNYGGAASYGQPRNNYGGVASYGPPRPAGGAPPPRRY